MQHIQTTRLSSGLLVATDFVQDFNSAVVIIICKTGSRNENKNNNGISHFLEHMAFKGTKKRTALMIAEEVESRGGDMNAYTSKEHTAYFIKLLNNDIEIAIDILSDIINNSTFPIEELEKEKGTILQEIAMYLDDSADVNSDNFHKMAYKNSSLEMNIIGPKKNIQNMTREDLVEYFSKHYYNENMVFGFCGNTEHEKIVEICNKKFKSSIIANSNKKIVDTQKSKYNGGIIIKNKSNLEQVQFLLGFKGFSYDIKEEDDLYATQIMSEILGGGMSSRLFHKIREEKGLVYTISSHNESYKDNGMFVIHAGVDAKNVDELCKLIKEEIHKITLGVTEKEIQKTIQQYKASLLMSVESTRYRAQKVASNLLTYGRYIPAEEIIKKVEKVDNEKVINIMKKILSNAKKDKPTVAIHGNVKGKINENLLDSWLV